MKLFKKSTQQRLDQLKVQSETLKAGLKGVIESAQEEQNLADEALRVEAELLAEAQARFKAANTNHKSEITQLKVLAVEAELTLQDQKDYRALAIEKVKAESNENKKEENEV